MLNPLRPQADQKNRNTYLGASDTVRIVRGEGQKVWLEKTNRSEQENLSEVFRVQLGKFTEDFILDWSSKVIDIEIGRRQTFITHPDYHWLACTIDGASEGSPWSGENCVFEAKHSNQWATDYTIFDSYYWQVQHQAYVGGFEDGALVYAAGNNWGGVIPVEIDTSEFEFVMLPKLERLWNCIETDTPYEDEEKTPSPALNGLITYDLSDLDTADQYNWGPKAIELDAALCRDKKVSDRYESLKKELREMVPENARMVILPGLSVRRSKTGTLAVHFDKK